MVREWRNRSLSETKFPYIVTDVLYIKVREDRRVVSKSCHVAIGISESGNREIIGLMIQDGESESTWANFFKYLNKRGLYGTKLVISDSHTGLVFVICQSFTGVSWQRCRVYFMRNVLTHVPKRDSKAFREAIKSIFRFTDIELARRAKNELIDQFA